MTTESLSLSSFLFVYGSLRRSPNGCLHRLLQANCDFVDKAHIPGRLFCLGDYPCAIFDYFGPDDLIHGEVYRLRQPNLTLHVLDDYEECLPQHPQPHEYRRLLKSITLNQGEMIEAWLYAYNRSIDGLTRINCGDYQPYKNNNHD